MSAESRSDRFTERLLRTVAPAIVLALFWWGLQWNPTAVATTTVVAPPNAEEARELAELGRAARDTGDHERAAEVFERLNELHPGNPIHLWNLARAYGATGRFKEEAETWDAYSDVASRPIDACPAIGLAHRRAGDSAASIKAFENCLDLDPLNSDSLFFMGHSMEITLQFDRAMKLYARGLELAPDYHDISLGIARIGLHQGDARQAVTAATAVLKEIPDSTDAMLVAGMGLRALGDLKAAEEILLSGLELNEGYTDFYIVLGGIAEQNSEVGRAREHYRKALELDPAHQHASARLRILTGDAS